MGKVYLARDPQMDRDVALKTIRADGLSSDDRQSLRVRFLKEARLAGRLLHPNIVTVFDVGEDSGVLFLAMEFVKGETLGSRLGRATEPLRVKETLTLGAEIADALAHAHSRGVLHRDIKPANILLTDDGTAKVTDFGIGKLMEGETTTLTGTGQLVGSPAYMSPEQIRGEKLDGRSDLFSLGTVLYQCLTLERPFSGESLTNLVYQILSSEPVDVRKLCPSIPEDVAALVMRSLAKRPAERIASASEMAAEMRQLSTGARGAAPDSGLSTAPTVFMEPTPPTPRLAPSLTSTPTAGPSQNRRNMVLALSLSAVALLAIAVGFLLARHPPRQEFVDQRPLLTFTPAFPQIPSPTPSLAPSATPQAPGDIRLIEMATPVAPLAPAGPTPAPARPHVEKPSPVPVSKPAEAEDEPLTGAGRRTVTTRRHVTVRVSPEEARVFLNGKFVGTADDWDGRGGGGMLTFPSEGKQILRITYPGRRDLLVTVVVTPNAEDDEAEIDNTLEEGSPSGPPGPPGDFRRPNYQTRGPVVFLVEPATARITVDGKDSGLAQDFTSAPLLLQAMKVHEVTVFAEGFEPRPLRILSSPSADDEKAVVKLKLKVKK